MLTNKSRLLCIILALVMIFTIASCAADTTTTGPTDKTTKGSADETTKGSADETTTETEASTDTKPSTLINPPGEYPIVNEPVTLRVFMRQGANVEDLVTNKFSVQIQERTGVTFDWDIATVEGFAERKSLALASGDLPDVFLAGSFTKAEQMRYGKQGILIPLNDLITEWATENVVGAFDEVPYLRADVTAPDGNIYAMPHINECYHCWTAQKLWINTAWLKAVGLNMPTTTDEFYAVLKAFKEQDPNQNGKADEIPLSGAIDGWHSNPGGFLMNPFIYNDMSTFFYVKDGVVGLSANQPEWREGLKFIRKLYDEGLVDPQAFTQTQVEVQQIARDPDNHVLGSATGGHPGMIWTNAEGETRIHEYDICPPLTGPEGVANCPSFKGIALAGFAITNKASDDEAIISMRILDYMYSLEGTLGDELGVEGSFWQYGKEGQTDFHGKPALYYMMPEWFNTPIQNSHWAQTGPSYRPRARFEGRAVSQDLYTMDGYELRLFVETDKQQAFIPDEYYPPSVYMGETEAEESAVLKTSIDDYIKQSMVQYIVGQRDVNSDGDWEDYISGFDGMSLNRYLEIYQAAYDVYKVSMK